MPIEPTPTLSFVNCGARCALALDCVWRFCFRSPTAVGLSGFGVLTTNGMRILCAVAVAFATGSKSTP